MYGGVQPPRPFSSVQEVILLDGLLGRCPVPGAQWVAPRHRTGQNLTDVHRKARRGREGEACAPHGAAVHQVHTVQPLSGPDGDDACSEKRPLPDDLYGRAHNGVGPLPVGGTHRHAKARQARSPRLSPCAWVGTRNSAVTTASASPKDSIRNPSPRPARLPTLAHLAQNLGEVHGADHRLVLEGRVHLHCVRLLGVSVVNHSPRGGT